MNKWLNISHDWLLPRRCLLCLGDAQQRNLCRLCLRALPRIACACSGCGLPLPHPGRCGRCLQRPPPFDRVCIPFCYQPPLSRLILALKFERQLTAAAALGSLLLDAVVGLEPLPQLILPVPLHRARVRQRGFNQALEIARPVAQGLGIELAPRLVRRERNTLAQSGLEGPAARRRNLRGAFRCNKKKLSGVRHLAILDDVVTSCATATELAHSLKRAGVQRVELWSVARASGH